jgi:hypothetical protein
VELYGPCVVIPPPSGGSWVPFYHPLIRVVREACNLVPIWSIDRCTYNGDLIGTFSRSCARVCQAHACLQPYQVLPIYNASSRPSSASQYRLVLFLTFTSPLYTFHSSCEDAASSPLLLLPMAHNVGQSRQYEVIAESRGRCAGYDDLRLSPSWCWQRGYNLYDRTWRCG